MNDMLKTTPDFSTETAAALLSEHYGLTGALSPLASERDQNFKVESPAGSFILKIVNAAEPEVESDFQTALLAHIGTHAGDLPVPHIRPTVTGERSTCASGTSARSAALSSVSSMIATSGPADAWRTRIDLPTFSSLKMPWTYVSLIVTSTKPDASGGP